MIVDLPEGVTVEAIVLWLAEHAPELLGDLASAFRDDPNAVERTLDGDGASAAKLTAKKEV